MDDIFASVERAARPRLPAWLLLYCFISAVTAPVWTMMNLVKHPMTTSLLLPQAIAGAVSGLLLWNLKSAGLRWARVSFLYAFGFAIVLSIRLAATKHYSAIGYAALGALPSAIWWACFRRSKKVRQIFGSNMAGLLATPGK